MGWEVFTGGVNSFFNSYACAIPDTSSSKGIKLDKDMRPYNGDTVAYSIRYSGYLQLSFWKYKMN